MTAPQPADPAVCTCEQVQVQVFDYVEGDLSDELHDAVRAHLDRCPACTEFVRTYSAVGGLVRSAMEVEVDEALQAELDAAIFAALEQTA